MKTFYNVISLINVTKVSAINFNIIILNFKIKIKNIKLLKVEYEFLINHCVYCVTFI